EAPQGRRGLGPGGGGRGGEQGAGAAGHDAYGTQVQGRFPGPRGDQGPVTEIGLGAGFFLEAAARLGQEGPVEHGRQFGPVQGAVAVEGAGGGITPDQTAGIGGGYPGPAPGRDGAGVGKGQGSPGVARQPQAPGQDDGELQPGYGLIGLEQAPRIALDDARPGQGGDDLPGPMALQVREAGGIALGGGSGPGRGKAAAGGRQGCRQDQDRQGQGQDPAPDPSPGHPPDIPQGLGAQHNSCASHNIL